MYGEEEGSRISKVALIGGILLLVSVFVPTGFIAANGKGYTTWPWMEPLVWPLIGLAIFLLVASFSVRTRRWWFLAIVVGTVCAFILLYVTDTVITFESIYSYWYGNEVMENEIEDIEGFGGRVHLFGAVGLLIVGIALKVRERLAERG